MVRCKGESSSRVTLREPEGVRVKEICRWCCVTRASERVGEGKKMSHLNVWGRMEEERVAGGRTDRKLQGRKHSCHRFQRLQISLGVTNGH